MTLAQKKWLVDNLLVLFADFHSGNVRSKTAKTNRCLIEISLNHLADKQKKSQTNYKRIFFSNLFSGALAFRRVPEIISAA